jgi:hypothetical protein
MRQNLTEDELTRNFSIAIESKYWQNWILASDCVIQWDTAVDFALLGG